MENYGKIRDPFEEPEKDENRAEKHNSTFLFVVPPPSPKKGEEVESEARFIDIIEAPTEELARKKYEDKTGEAVPENVIVIPEDDEHLRAA